MRRGLPRGLPIWCWSMYNIVPFQKSHGYVYMLSESLWIQVHVLQPLRAAFSGPIGSIAIWKTSNHRNKGINLCTWEHFHSYTCGQLCKTCSPSTPILVLVDRFFSNCVGILSLLRIQNSPDRLRGSHITQYRWGYCKSEHRWGYKNNVLWGYSDVTVAGATVHPKPTEYSHSTLNGTLTLSSHSSTV